MSGNKHDNGPKDPSTIDLKDPEDVLYTCSTWNISKWILATAISKVGNDRQKIEIWLKEKKYIK